jgi:hypothetical protein
MLRQGLPFGEGGRGAVRARLIEVLDIYALFNSQFYRAL